MVKVKRGVESIKIRYFTICSIVLCISIFWGFHYVQKNEASNYLKSYAITVVGEPAVIPQEEKNQLIQYLLEINPNAEKRLKSIGTKKKGTVTLQPEELLYIYVNSIPEEAIADQMNEMRGKEISISYQSIGRFSAAWVDPI